MHHVKKLVERAMLLLAVLGVGVAMVNLPLRTGCDFYGHCAADGKHEPAMAQAPDGLDAEQ